MLLSLFGVSQYFLDAKQITIPPALLGIAILFIGLLLYRCVPPPITLVAKPLLGHMSLFFIPAIVAIVNYIDLIIAFPMALFLAIVVSTLISLALTALLSQWLMKKLTPSEPDTTQTPSKDVV